MITLIPYNLIKLLYTIKFDLLRPITPPNNPNSMDEIPANPIENENSSFSPIKFVVKKEKESQELEVIDDEISITKMASGKRGDFVGISECESKRIDTVATEEVNTVNTVGTCDIPETMDIVDTVNNSKIQRRSDEDSICNTPKRERNENEKLNRRFIRQLQEGHGESVADNDDDDGDILTLDGDASLPKTPQKQINNTFTTTNNNPNNPNSATTTADSTHSVTSNNNNKECVRSLSQEFEQRLNSIHVSPITNTTGNKNNNSTSRSMSPIRSIAQLSPVSKLNLNDTGDDDSNNINSNYTTSNNSTGSTTTENVSIITPKLVSPSKIASQVEIEKIKCGLESKVKQILC